MDSRAFITAAVAGTIAAGRAAGQGISNTMTVQIDLGRETGPFPHYWKQCAGSDRTAVALRAQWQQVL
jgi:hypothetical protein